MTSTPNTTQYLVVDTSVLVAVVDSQDKFHSQANTLATAAQVRQYQLIYFDCVVIETIGVLCRRAEEQKRSAMLPALLTSLEYLVPPSRISWTGGHLPRRYDSVLDLVRNTHGLLNFNDALIAILCQELSIGSIMSFDRDFDQIAWLRRVSSPQAL